MRIFAAVCMSFLCLLMNMPGVAEENREHEDVQKGVAQVMSGLNLEAVQDIEVMGMGKSKSVGEAVRELAAGGSISAEDAVSGVIRLFLDSAAGLGRLMLAIMLPVLLSGLLSHTFVQGSSGNGMLARSVSFMLILIPVIHAVIAELEHARLTITSMTERMDRLLPILLTLLTALGGNASTAFFHPIVVAASGSMVFLAREVILRLVMCTCAVTAVNHLSDRIHLSRMAQLLRSAVCWLLGVSFTVFLGAMSLQGVCSASIDGVAIRAAKYAVDNFVPIVGGMFSDTMDTLVGCTLIVKNALGVTCALVLLGTVLAPLMRTAAVVFVMKLSAALLEPVAESEVIRAIGDFARTIVLFFVTMLCVCTMYFLLIVQLLLVGNLTAMFR